MKPYIYYRFDNIDMKPVLTRFVPMLGTIERGTYFETPYIDSLGVEFVGERDAVKMLDVYSTVGEAYIHADGLKTAILIGPDDNRIGLRFRGSLDKDAIDLDKVLQIKDQFESAMHQAGYPVQILESTFPEPATNIAA